MKRFNNQAELKNIRKSLRKNMTKDEVLLWIQLKNKKIKGEKFRRQHGIGRYIVDFYCPACKLAVELDGGQHYDSVMEEKDRFRTEYLNSVGVKVVRFTNLDIRQNMTGVLLEISEHL